jgi:hypothetical protein
MPIVIHARSREEAEEQARRLAQIVKQTTSQWDAVEVESVKPLRGGRKE